MAMNPTLSAIQNVIKKNMAVYLPDVSPESLEDGGQIFYMNGKDGTEFDWFVNGRLCPFMVFYDDEDNLGAVKALVAKNGEITLCFYGDAGKKMVKELTESLDVTEEDLLKLAANLRLNADEKGRWDASSDAIELDDDVSPQTVDDFLSDGQELDPTAVRKEVLGKFAFVSKKITQEGWKVGYMFRDDPEEDDDSGWQFFAGDEDDDYSDDPDNVEMNPVAAVVELDPVVMNYLGSPVGASFVRVSSDEFEEDDGQDPYVEKR